MKEGQTIGQWLNWDFETNGDLEINDKNGRLNYYELSNGFWSKWEYDLNGNEIYYENSKGEWVKRQYDSQGIEIYYESSNGTIIDKRFPEIIGYNGRKYKLMP